MQRRRASSVAGRRSVAPPRTGDARGGGRERRGSPGWDVAGIRRFGRPGRAVDVVRCGGGSGGRGTRDGPRARRGSRRHRAWVRPPLRRTARAGGRVRTDTRWVPRGHGRQLGSSLPGRCGTAATSGGSTGAAGDQRRGAPQTRDRRTRSTQGGSRRRSWAFADEPIRLRRTGWTGCNVHGIRRPLGATRDGPGPSAVTPDMGLALGATGCPKSTSDRSSGPLTDPEGALPEGLGARRRAVARGP